MRLEALPLRRLATAGVALALAACDDPELRLELRIAPPYRDAVAAIALQVYAPPAAAPFDCEALAFSRIDPSAVALSRIAEVSADGLEARVEDLDRRARKLFVGDGLAADGVRLVRGCAELGEVRDEASVEIQAEPIPTVDAADAPVLSTTLGLPPPPPVTLRVTDAFHRALAGVPVEYAIDGAGGLGASGRETSDPSGRVVLSPPLPTRPGPFVLDIRVRWAEAGMSLLSGVVARKPEILDVPGRALDHRAGRLGPAGERGIAVLVADTGGTRVVLRMAGADAWTSSGRIAGAAVLGLVEDASGGRDRIIVATPSSWLEVDADGHIVTSRELSMPLGATAPTRIVPGGPCSGSAERGAYMVFDTGAVGFYSVDGELGLSFTLSDDAFNPVDILASGCVSNQDGGLERTLVFGRGSGIGVYPAIPVGEADFLFADWFALSSAIAFGPMDRDGRRLLFGTQLNLNDIVVSRGSVRRTSSGASVVIEGLDPIPDVPVATAAGDIDGDGLVDVVSLFTRVGKGQVDQLALWVALGREHGGRRIAGDLEVGKLSGSLLAPPALLVIDLDGDGLDEVVLGEVSSLPGTGPSSLMIYSMRAP